MRMQWIRQGWPPVLVVILLLFGWEAAVAWWNVPQWILPSPLKIFTEANSILPRLWIHTAATLNIMLVGFGLGVACGLLTALILHLIPGFKQGFYPLLILSQNIPIIVLGPLLMIWFGFGMLPKVLVIILMVFFPVTVSALDGFSRTDQNMLNYMRMIGAGRGHIFMKLELPYALPYIFSGLKISATYSVMSAVIAEWLGAENGIGVFMTLSSSAFRTDRVFVAIFVIVILSLVMFGMIRALEKWFIRWKPQK